MEAKKDRVKVIVAPVFVNGVGIIREMAKKGAHVVAVDSAAEAVGFRSRHVREKFVLPSPQESPGCFSQWLLSRRDLYGAIVIPTDDFYVGELVADYDALSPHYRLAVSPGEAVAIALDKARAYEAASEAGMAIPKTRSLRRAADLAEASRHVGFPAILRPVSSIAFYKQFGTKSFFVDTVASLEEGFRRASEAGHPVLLQEVVPGADGNVVSCKVYATDSGKILSPVAGFKYAIYPPGFGVSQIQVARPAPEVETQTVRLLEHIGFRGSLASVEWKYDRRDAVWKFLEINPRSVLAIALMKFVGADVLDMLWRDKLGLPQLPERPVKYGRRWAYLKNGLLLYRRHPELRKSLRDYARLYRPPICFGLLDPFDLKPFLYDIAPLLGRRLARKAPH